jgi:hypothetical protein
VHLPNDTLYNGGTSIFGVNNGELAIAKASAKVSSVVTVTPRKALVDIPSHAKEAGSVAFYMRTD